VRARRTLSSSLRAKVLERDGHRCMAPGCGLPSGSEAEEGRGHFLVVHHLDPVALGGKDDPHRLVTLCPGGHDLVHQHLLSVERDDAGELRWAPLPGKGAAGDSMAVPAVVSRRARRLVALRNASDTGTLVLMDGTCYTQCNTRDSHHHPQPLLILAGACRSISDGSYLFSRER